MKNRLTGAPTLSKKEFERTWCAQNISGNRKLACSKNKTKKE